MLLSLLSRIGCGLVYEVSWMVSSKYAWRPLLQVSGVLLSAIGARLLGAQEVRGMDFPPRQICKTSGYVSLAN